MSRSTVTTIKVFPQMSWASLTLRYWGKIIPLKYWKTDVFVQWYNLIIITLISIITIWKWSKLCQWMTRNPLFCWGEPTVSCKSGRYLCSWNYFLIPCLWNELSLQYWHFRYDCHKEASLSDVQIRVDFWTISSLFDFSSGFHSSHRLKGDHWDPQGSWFPTTWKTDCVRQSQIQKPLSSWKHSHWTSYWRFLPPIFPTYCLQRRK